VPGARSAERGGRVETSIVSRTPSTCRPSARSEYLGRHLLGVRSVAGSPEESVARALTRHITELLGTFVWPKQSLGYKSIKSGGTFNCAHHHSSAPHSHSSHDILFIPDFLIYTIPCSHRVAPKMRGMHGLSGCNGDAPSRRAPHGRVERGILAGLRRHAKARLPHYPPAARWADEGVGVARVPRAVSSAHAARRHGPRPSCVPFPARPPLRAAR